MPKFDFQSQVAMSKIIGIFLIFFSLKNMQKGTQHVFMTYFHNFDFKFTLFSKCVPDFLPLKPKRIKGRELFYAHQIGAEAILIHP